LFRSGDGLTLYAVSSDGTLGVFAFEADELGGIASFDDHRRYLHKFHFTPPPLPLDYVHPGQAGDISSSQPTRVSAPSGTPHGEVINTLVAKRKDKRAGPRRVNLMPNVPSAGIPSASTSSAQPRSNGYTAATPHIAPRPGSASSRPVSAAYQRLPAASNAATSYTTDGFGFEDVHMDDLQASMRDGVASIVALDTSSPQARRRIATDALGDESRLKARTLGGDRQRENIPVRELASASQQPYTSGMDVSRIRQPVLPTLPVLTVVSTRVNQGSIEYLLEGKNSDAGRK
jgi:protein HIRA/HIR1